MIASMTMEAIEQASSAKPTKRSRPTVPVAAWIRLMRVYHKLHRRAEQTSRRHGLSLGRFDVLNHAGVREGRTQQELADALFVTKANICQLVDGMETDGLLARRRAGRANQIALTDAGRALRATILTEHEAELAEAFQALTVPEQATLLRLLAKLDRSLG